MPILSGDTAYCLACDRIRRMACSASATAMTRAGRILIAKASKDSAPGARVGGRTRYLRTKAVNPRAVNHWAVSVPSRSQGRARKAPPGTTTTAVPFALLAGRKTERVGTVTLVMMWTLPRSGKSASTACSRPLQLSVPGACPCHRRTTSGEATRRGAAFPHAATHEAHNKARNSASFTRSASAPRWLQRLSG